MWSIRPQCNDGFGYSQGMREPLQWKKHNRLKNLNVQKAKHNLTYVTCLSTGIDIGTTCMTKSTADLRSRNDGMGYMSMPLYITDYQIPWESLRLALFMLFQYMILLPISETITPRVKHMVPPPRPRGPCSKFFRSKWQKRVNLNPT